MACLLKDAELSAILFFLSYLVYNCTAVNEQAGVVISRLFVRIYSFVFTHVHSSFVDRLLSSAYQAIELKSSFIHLLRRWSEFLYLHTFTYQVQVHPSEDQ